MGASNEKIVNWSIFISLAAIWGSSFILMKEGMKMLTATQVASLRILSAALVLMPVAINKLRTVDRRSAGWIILSGILGNLLPAYLFCVAETKIDSSLAGFINAFTPVFTLLMGVLIFRNHFEKNKLTGILTGFAGMCILFFSKDEAGISHVGYSGLVVLAALSYALNANMVGRYLKGAGALTITSIGVVSMMLPAGIILVLSGFFQLPVMNKERVISITASVFLGIMGTAISTVFFYYLLKRAGAVFASMVTYAIPFVALFWGLMAGENIGLLQIAGLLALLAGVWMASR